MMKVVLSMMIFAVFWLKKVDWNYESHYYYFDLIEQTMMTLTVALLNVVLLWVGYNSFALRQFWWLTGNTTWLQSVAKPIVSG